MTQDKRNEPEEKAKEPGPHRAPGFEEVNEPVPDPSGDTKSTDSDGENVQTNDSSFTDYDDKETERPGS